MGKHQPLALGSQQTASGGFHGTHVDLGCFCSVQRPGPWQVLRKLPTPALVHGILFACRPCQLHTDPTVSTSLTFLSLPNTELCPESPASPAQHYLGLQDCQLSDSHLHANLYSAANKLGPKALCKMSYRHLQLGRSQGLTRHTAIFDEAVL